MILLIKLFLSTSLDVTNTSFNSTTGILLLATTTHCLMIKAIKPMKSSPPPIDNNFLGEMLMTFSLYSEMNSPIIKLRDCWDCKHGNNQNKRMAMTKNSPHLKLGKKLKTKKNAIYHINIYSTNQYRILSKDTVL